MPRYSYHCKECLKDFEAIHSYKDTQTECLLCGVKNSLEKILSSPVNLRKDTTKRSKKPGHIVNQSIEENKIELKEQKKKLKNRS